MKCHSPDNFTLTVDPSHFTFHIPHHFTKSTKSTSTCACHLGCQAWRRRASSSLPGQFFDSESNVATATSAVKHRCQVFQAIKTVSDWLAICLQTRSLDISWVFLSAKLEHEKFQEWCCTTKRKTPLRSQGNHTPMLGPERIQLMADNSWCLIQLNHQVAQKCRKMPSNENGSTEELGPPALRNCSTGIATTCCKLPVSNSKVTKLLQYDESPESQNNTGTNICNLAPTTSSSSNASNFASSIQWTTGPPVKNGKNGKKQYKASYLSTGFCCALQGLLSPDWEVHRNGQGQTEEKS